jgi:hypothetical protein
MARAIFCIAIGEEQAVAIVEQLKEAGFSHEISVLLPQATGIHEVAHVHHTKAPEGAIAGTGAGGLAGGTLGLLAGIGSLAIPGVGPLMAAGPIMAALSGAAVGATVGGMAGALVGMGIPEYEAKQYEVQVGEGSILISVHTEDRGEIRRVKAILAAAGANGISVASEVKARTPRP